MNPGDTLPISQVSRLLLYIGIAILPIWIDFFTKSTDYSFRGLAMPTLSSLLAALTVTLARTTAKKPLDANNPTPVEVINPPDNPVPTTETK